MNNSNPELDDLLSMGSILPQAVSETGAGNEPLQEVIVCDSISGGADYENDMPRRLSLIRRLADGNEYRMEYSQSGWQPLPEAPRPTPKPTEA